MSDIGGASRLERRMVERVLTRCADMSGVDIEPLMTLLRRFAAEAADMVVPGLSQPAILALSSNGVLAHHVGLAAPRRRSGPT